MAEAGYTAPPRPEQPRLSPWEAAGGRDARPAWACIAVRAAAGQGPPWPAWEGGGPGCGAPLVILPAAARVDIYIAKCCKYMLHCCIGALFTQQGGVACRGVRFGEWLLQ